MRTVADVLRTSARNFRTNRTCALKSRCNCTSAWGEPAAEASLAARRDHEEATGESPSTVVYHLLSKCYSHQVPTTRPRHLVTETDELAAALDAAAARWPGVSRAQLLVRLAMEGHKVAQQLHDEGRSRRIAAVRQHSGVLTGTYGPDYLHELRDDWPA